MQRKMIPAEEAFAEWREDPAFVAAYDALADEFAAAEAEILARDRASPATPRQPPQESDSP